MDQFAADPPVEQRVGDLLGEREETLALAESATGGLVGALVTAVPGASDYFDRSVVTYSYDSKRDLLAVDRESLDEEGAVSATVARQMAAGVRDTADDDWGVSVTGVAGPTGGTEATPVGTVFVGVAHAAPWGTGDSYVRAVRHVFDGDRAATRERFARAALSELRADLAG